VYNSYKYYFYHVRLVRGSQEKQELA